MYCHVGGSKTNPVTIQNPEDPEDPEDSKCHIRQSQNIQYSNRIVHRRKHPVMVVNAENIRN